MADWLDEIRKIDTERKEAERRKKDEEGRVRQSRQRATEKYDPIVRGVLEELDRAQGIENPRISSPDSRLGYYDGFRRSAAGHWTNSKGFKVYLGFDGSRSAKVTHFVVAWGYQQEVSTESPSEEQLKRALVDLYREGRRPVPPLQQPD